MGWKANYFVKLIQLLDEYPKCFIVGADNVGSKQLQQIRRSLRGCASVLMGKNTMIRKAIRGHLENNPHLKKLLPHIKGNVGFVFTNNDLVEVRDKLLDNKVQAPARAGALAPCPVFIEPQNTGLGPEKTSFFQALSIPTKISKGTIEIITRVSLIKEGDRVDASAATLLNMLNISPSPTVLLFSKFTTPELCLSPRSSISSPRLFVSVSWRVLPMLLACRCVSATQHWHRLPTRSSTDSRTCWLLLQPLTSNSRKRLQSKSFWRILPSSQLPPPPLLRLQPPQLPPLLLRLKRRSRNPKRVMMTWASVCSTKPKSPSTDRPAVTSALFNLCCCVVSVQTARDTRVMN